MEKPMKYLLFFILFLAGCSQPVESPSPSAGEVSIVYTYPYPAYCSSITVHPSGVLDCSQDTSNGKTLSLHILGPLECHNGLVKSKNEEVYCL